MADVTNDIVRWGKDKVLKFSVTGTRYDPALPPVPEGKSAAPAGFTRCPSAVDQQIVART